MVRRLEMELKQYTDTELEAELERRKVVPFPGMYFENDVALRKLLCAYIDYVVSKDYHEDNDWEHHIYECVLETYYSKDIWDWWRATIK